MKEISACLWFDNQAEEAMIFYMSVFKNSRVVSISHYTDGGMGEPGKVMSVTFELNGQEFMALNGGPQQFGFSEAISFFVNCENQKEVDTLWEKLCEGGEPGPCGWLKDKYGVSWQIVPTALGELLGDKDPVKAARVMQAMLKMGKLEIAGLQKAYAGT